MRRLLAALAATGAVLGLSAATAAGQSAPALTITAPADRSSAPFSARAEIRGTLAGNPEGDAGQPVTLEAAPYPYTTFKPAGQAMTGADGSFSLPVRVSVNARYRVRGPHDATSAPITIFAKPFHKGRMSFKTDNAKGETGSLDLVLRSGPVRLDGVRVPVFFADGASDDEFRRVGVARVRTRHGISRIALRFKLNGFGEGPELRWCYDLRRTPLMGDPDVPCPLTVKRFNRANPPAGMR